VLGEARILAEGTIEDSGGSHGEADIVATAVVAHIAWGWDRLGLHQLAGDPQRWKAHLVRESYRRWLDQLCRVRGRWAVPVSESLSRARLLALADAANFPPLERALFDHIYVFGFSVAETAAAFALERSELIRRLRILWAQIRTEYASVFEEPGPG